MSEHTPGPWVYHYSRSDPADEWIIGASGFSTVLAFVVRDTEAPLPGATIEANARVMVAAPDLLDACKQQQLLIADMVRFVGEMALQDYALLNDAPLAASRAIAKAEGRAP